MPGLHQVLRCTANKVGTIPTLRELIVQWEEVAKHNGQRMRTAPRELEGSERAVWPCGHR